MMNQNKPSQGGVQEIEPNENPPSKLALDESVRVMSFNVLSDDNAEHAWAARKQKVASTIRFHRADLIGMQEPSLAQIEDLIRILPEYQAVSGISLGENGQDHDPIFFRKSRFELLNTGYFFLSPTPEVPSKGWDAKFPRATVWVHLRDLKTQKTFFFFNTHFDYHGRESRDEGARLLRERIGGIAGSAPFAVTGDFNLFPTLGGPETLKILTDKSLPAPLVDAQTASLLPHHGPTGTWCGFKEAGQPGVKPDYIFVSSSVSVYVHGILADTFDGGFPSDHLPVIAEIALP